MHVLWRTADSENNHGLLMLGWPQAPWHLELVDDPALKPTPSGEDLLVLYLGAPAGEDFEQRIIAAGGRRVPSRNPYWDEWGLTFEDTDGYRIVLCHREWDNRSETD